MSTATGSATLKDHPGSPSVLARIKEFFGSSEESSASHDGGETAADSSTPSALYVLPALLAERDRVEGLALDEENRAKSLKDQLREAEECRIDALTRARLDGDQDVSLPEQLCTELSTLRASIGEAEAIATRLRAEVDRLNKEITPVREKYRQELGVYMDALYRQAIDQYNALAPNVAQAVIRVAGIRRFMIRNALGNSNGWDGSILLPRMKWQEGRTLSPMLDGGSVGFAEAAEQASHIERELRASGLKIDW